MIAPFECFDDMLELIYRLSVSVLWGICCESAKVCTAGISTVTFNTMPNLIVP